jgi:hypothetical protein
MMVELRHASVFLHVVHHIAKGVANGHRVKSAPVYLPGFTSQQKRIALVDRLKKMRANVIVPIGPGPTAVGEATLGVLFGTTRRLHDAIQRNKFSND